MTKIDLTDYLGINTFDRVMKTIDEVVEQSESLSLDSREDRRTLKRALAVRLGAIIEDEHDPEGADL